MLPRLRTLTGLVLLTSAGPILAPVLHPQPIYAQAQSGEQQFQQGRTQLQAGQYKEALVSFQQALQLFQQANDGPGVVKTLRNLGNIFHNVGDASTAISFFQQSLTLAQQVGDRSGEAYALQNLGSASDTLGQYAQALRYHQQSLDLYRQLQDKSGEAAVLGNFGNTAFATAQYAQAIAYYQQSLDLARQLKDRELEGNALGNLGTVSYAQADYARAITYHEQYLAIVRERQDRYGEKSALNNLGNDYLSLGQYARALDYHQQSLALARQMGDRLGEGQSLANIGLTYINIGDVRQAITYQLQSLEISRALKNRPAEARNLGNLGNAYLAIRDFAKARDYHQQRLAIARELGDPAGEIKALNNLGNVYKIQGQYAEAQKFYQDVLKRSRALQDKEGEETALINLGSVAISLKNYDQAIAYQQQAAKLARELRDRPGEAIALNNLGNAYFLQGKAAAAEAPLRQALQTWESLRTDLGGNDANKVAIFEQQARTYRLLQQVLVAQQKTDAALEVSERGKARAFVELVAGRLSAQNPNLDTPPNLQQIKQIARDQKATLVQYSLTFEDIQVQGEEEAREADLLIWVIQPTGKIDFRRVDLRPLWQPQAEMLERFSATQTLVSQMRRSLGAGDRGFAFQENEQLLAQVIANQPELPANQSLQQLHQILIQPIADLLPARPEERVIFVPQGALFLVPFPALQSSSGKPLIERHTVSVAPSIQALELTRQQRLAHSWRGTPAPNSLLIVGNPTMPSLAPSAGAPPKQLPALPGAEQEAKAIATLFQARAMTGGQATKAAVLQQMPQARIIHLATHGLLDDGRNLGVPGAIALAPSGQDNGLLTASEILNLKLKAELVVLSACDTGRGRITGDGVIGLSRSLISAGVPSVVVSLWQVPDAPTATLMTEFYRQLQQQPDKAKALRQAMLKTRQQFPDPKDWAAFTLIGEAE